MKKAENGSAVTCNRTVYGEHIGKQDRNMVDCEI